jgi:hypothetical protein
LQCLHVRKNNNNFDVGVVVTATPPKLWDAISEQGKCYFPPPLQAYNKQKVEYAMEVVPACQGPRWGDPRRSTGRLLLKSRSKPADPRRFLEEV